jgi:hypothetical protein
MSILVELSNSQFALIICLGLLVVMHAFISHEDCDINQVQVVQTCIMLLIIMSVRVTKVLSLKGCCTLEMYAKGSYLNSNSVDSDTV